MLKRKITSIIYGIILLFATPIVAYAKDYQHLVVFGDSLSDNGIDDGQGFRRYSNGKVWAEYLAEKIGTKSLKVNAWGGATSGIGNYNGNAKDWSGLQWQIQQYAPKSHLDDTLVIVQIGTNDLHDPDTKIEPQTVVDNVKKALEQLSEKGASQIVVWNLNTTLVSPGYIDKDYQWYDYYKDKKNAAITQYKLFNQLLKPMVSDFNASQEKTRVILFDADQAITDIAKSFENTTTPWQGTKFYPKAGGWFWFDHWHYMTEVHQKLSEHLFDTLSNHTK